MKIPEIIQIIETQISFKKTSNLEYNSVLNVVK